MRRTHSALAIAGGGLCGLGDVLETRPPPMKMLKNIERLGCGGLPEVRSAGGQ